MRAANQQDLIYKRGQLEAGVTKASVTIVFYHCRPPFPLKETNVIFIGLTTGD